VVGLVFGAGIAFYQRRPFLKYTASVGGNFTIGSFCFFCECLLLSAANLNFAVLLLSLTAERGRHHATLLLPSCRRVAFD
jgi:hypothetical protein